MSGTEEPPTENPGMEIVVPLHVIQEIAASRFADADRAANDQIDLMTADVAAQSQRMVAVRVDGEIDAAREMTAAVFLIRACELLREVRMADRAPMLQALGLRSVLELALVGRYLLEHPKADDEFHRRVQLDFTRRAALARSVGLTAASPPQWLAHLLEGEPGEPRDVASIAGALDKLDGRQQSDRYSMTALYRHIFSLVSETVTHANIAGASRYTRADGHVLGVQAEPGVLFEDGPPVLLVAHVVYELSQVVFDVLRVPKDGLPDWPRRGEIPAEPRSS